MATVTKSIGTSSRDYSTITLWEADLDNDTPYDAGDHAVGECYNDSVFDEKVDINGGGTVGLNSVTLTVASGHRHTGVAGTGARIVLSASFTTSYVLIQGTNRVTKVQWLEVSANRKSSSTSGFICNCSDTASTKNYWQNLIVHGARFASSVSGGITAFHNDPGPHYTTNCIVYDIVSPDNRDALGIVMGAFDREAYVWNCTVFNLSTNSSVDPADGFTIADITFNHVKNCVAVNCVNAGSFGDNSFSPNSFSNADVNYCAGDNGTIPGANSISVTAANELVSTADGAEDGHLKAGASCIGAGVDLGTTVGVQFDIDNYDRDTTAVTWDIGADQYVASSYSLTANSIATGAPALGNPALTQNHQLTADGVTTGAPDLSEPALGQVHDLAADDVVTGAPELGEPQLDQVHALTALSVTTGAPQLGEPALGQTHLLSAANVTTGAPALGNPALNLDLTFTPSPARTIVVAPESRIVVVQPESRVVLVKA